MIETIQAHYEILTIPFVAAFIGWFTNRVAIEMMFRPVRFIGFRPWLGWQGIIPAGAVALAAKATDLITSRLIDVQGLFVGFDAQAFAARLSPELDRIADTIVRDIAEKHMPQMWEALGSDMREQVRQGVRAEIEQVAAGLLSDFAANIETIFNIRRVVIGTAQRDRALIAELFRRVGHKEFRFIEISGAWFGFLFGIPQMFLWAVWPAWWTLPLAGFLVGYATNWLALKLIFEPAEPRRIGPWVVQGLFHKRQHEVAAAFAQFVAERILTADNIVDMVMSDEGGTRLRALVAKRIDALADQWEAHPLAAMLEPSQRAALRADIQKRVGDDLAQPGGLLHSFAGQAVDVQGELFSRMSALDALSFEGTLRPAFQQDEWKLIIAGGALGLLAGWLQVVYIFEDMLREVVQR